MARREAQQVAKILAELYAEKFSEKGRDRRYQIARSDLIGLTGRKTIDDDLLKKIRERLHELGSIMVDLGDAFAVLEEGPLTGYRKVTTRFLKEYMEKRKEKRDELSPIAKKKRLKQKRNRF